MNCSVFFVSALSGSSLTVCSFDEAILLPFSSRFDTRKSFDKRFQLFFPNFFRFEILYWKLFLVLLSFAEWHKQDIIYRCIKEANDDPLIKWLPESSVWFRQKKNSSFRFFSGKNSSESMDFDRSFCSTKIYTKRWRHRFESIDFRHEKCFSRKKFNFSQKFPRKSKKNSVA